MKKIILIGCVLAFVIFLVWVIKFVAKVTPGYAVIKEYSYSGNVNDFIAQVESYSSKDTNVVTQLTDTTGTPERGYTFYISIELKDISYSIACENINENNKSRTRIELVMAYDKINNVGGYNKQAKGIMPLVKNFDANFLTPLQHTQNIKIVPLE